MVRFVGFLRPVLGVSFNGEVGAEKAWEVSMPGAVAGRGRDTAFIFSDKFLTFFELSMSVDGGIDGAVDIILAGCFCA